jgi:hypothetical protein
MVWGDALELQEPEAPLSDLLAALLLPFVSPTAKTVELPCAQEEVAGTDLAGDDGTGPRWRSPRQVLTGTFTFSRRCMVSCRR